MSGQGALIRLLGRLSIERPGAARATVFPGRRPELVFAYLAAEHHRDVSRDELADALWPHELPDAWASALRSVVSDVRRVIAAGELGGGELLERTGSGYRLRLPAEVVLDLDEVRAGLAKAREGVAGDPAAAAAAAAGAAELARLPFLPRHEGEWVDRVRGEIEGMLVEALELAERAYARAGDRRAAAAAAARLIEVEPYSDAAHRLRIEVLAAGGDRAGAARAYEQCRARLAEIGVEPSAETEAAQWVLATQPRVSADGSPSPARATSPFSTFSMLVVEDHDFQRRTALSLLSRLGVGALAEATDGAEALALLAKSQPPDIIVCDIDMPGMDGVEFIRHVAERRLASAVVIASGLERSVLQAVEAVAEGYGLQVLGAIEKPLTARRLSEVLNSFQRPAQSLGDPATVTDAELRAALDGGGIGARFSPIVDLQLGAISGAEALAAWSSAPGELPALVSGRFSEPLAAALADRVLALACGEQLELTTAGHEIPLWISLARGALGDVGRADRLLAVVRDRHADPRRIVFTVTERAVRRSTAAELDVLTRLRVKGFGICLEDYGHGRVSEQALARIPLTAVALAPGLVREAYDDAGRAAALEEALESIRAVGLPTVARGCDGAADYALLVQIGCGHAQGEFIAAAVAADELADWANGWSAPSIEDRTE